METEQHDCENPGEDNGVTILDALNADCWRAVLDFLDIDDVVRSERVSRDWQRIVLQYLQGVQKYRVVNDQYRYSHIVECGKYSKYHHIKLPKYQMHPEMFKKMGPFIVTLAIEFITEQWIISITSNCQNLENLTCLHAGESDRLPIGKLNDCKQLRRVTFDTITYVTDDFLGQFVKNEALEEIILNENLHLNGSFLADLKSTNLRILHVNYCISLRPDLLLTAAHLTELRNLEINDNAEDLLANMHLLLEKMPNLEHLSLNGYRKTNLGDELIECISRLGRLKHLSLSRNGNVTDAWLGRLARGCTELRTLHIGSCEVTARAVLALCRALAGTLTDLDLSNNPDVTVDVVAACVTCCRNLMMLDVTGCAGAFEALAAAAERAAQGRPRRLRLRVPKPVTERIKLNQTSGSGSKSQVWCQQPPQESYSQTHKHTGEANISVLKREQSGIGEFFTDSKKEEVLNKYIPHCH